MIRAEYVGFGILILLMLCLPTMADERSEQQILDVAAGVLCKQRLTRSLNGERDQALRIMQRRAAVTIVGADGGGFVLVSNDDNQRPVLGYSREGSFDADDLPSGFKWYLNALDESLTKQSPSRAAILPGDGVKPYVEPLIETDWWQGTPFNDWLPTYTDDNGNLRHYALDCSNTAAAQIMYYHRHPNIGRGETTYTYESDEDGHEVDVSCCFDTVRFEWDKMATLYNNRRSSNEDANEAVARLGKALCTASKMIYIRGGSKMGYSKAKALIDHFDYGPDIYIPYRENYADNLWLHMVFDDLSNNHPIWYHGTSPSGIGHAFVIDGYDANGLVHINWGWGHNSNYDGYFDMNELHPNNYPVSFSTKQHMMLNIRPKGQPLSMTSLTVSQPGTLSSLLADNPLQTRLKISGQLNADDLQALKQLGQQVRGSDGLIVSELTHLDLTDATLSDNILPEKAFESCTALLDVVLPSTLKAIGNQAFLGCNHLVHIGMPSGLQKIGSFAFQNCNNLTGIVIPREVETIGDAAFSACLANEAFTVETGNRHFSTVDGMLTNAAQNKLVCFPAKRSMANIPAAIDSIGRYAFRYCINLKELHIPGTVRVVDEWAFMNCQNLATVILDEGVQRILAGAFNNCDALTTLHLPATIDSIGRRPFIYCDNMQQVTMSDQNPNFRVVNNCLLSHDGKQLLQALFTEVETVDIPASVETINEFALYYLNIKRLTLPATLRKVDRQSIFFCQNLTQLDIEEGLEEINHFAFNGCSALTEVHLPVSVQTVGQAIFVNCSALNHVDISEASTLFRTDDNMLFSKDGTQLLQQFADDKEEYVVPTTVTSIASGCFRYLTKLQRLTIPSSVKSIGSNLFYGSKGLTDVFIQTLNPISLGNTVFNNIDLSKATLHVPIGSLSDYVGATGWGLFGSIVEDQPSDVKVVVAPLLKDKWGESSPFNLLCPEYDEGKQGVVGCGALSTAQIMRYWQWPVKGVGQNTYVSTLNYNSEHTVKLSADFGSTTYQWDQMLDDYKNVVATDQQQLAVATLCYHVGLAMNMNYGASSSNSKNQVEALNRHFCYYAKRLFNKSDEEYAEVMRRELDAGRPVLFHGENENSSRTHTFVCDGYGEDGYFHFNFGYWGKYNGYYRLSELVLPDGTDFRYHHRIHAYDMQPYRGEIPTGTVELTVNEPGTLQQLIDESAAPFAVSLKVSGPLNGADLLALRRLAGRDENNYSTGHIMTDLDLSDASFVPSEDIYWQYTTNGVTMTYTITDADRMPDNCFRNTNLRRIALPSSVTAVGSMAFYACYSLEEVMFNEHITTIGPSAFRNTGLKEVTIPDHITTIEQWAFGDNAQLKKVRIGHNVGRINYSAFNRSNAIEEITSDICLPFYIQNNVFSAEVFAKATLYVPAGTAPLYRRTQYWQLFSHIEEQDGEPIPLPYMVVASWHQKAPFNSDCPQVDGQPCAAGCGPIAMAQILSYYRQPSQGHGKVTYRSDFNGAENDINVDFDSHPFDWANIRDVYTDANSDAERRAVANLIYMTGAAMKQQYSPTGTTTVNYGTWMWGLQRYLHLSPTSRWLNRRYYSTSEWTAMIDQQLTAGHPVFYNAAHTEPFGGKSGHFFVIDGRDQQGNYHFNFGHNSSIQDKFTNLNAINQGSEPKPGNAYACYHYVQGMIVDGFPVEGLTDADFPRCEVSLSEPFVLEGDADRKEVTVTGSVQAKFQYRCISFDADDIQYSLGFYRNEQLAAVSPSWRQNRISIGGGVSNVNRSFILPEGLADGDYEMALVSRTSEDDVWRRGWDNVPNRVPVTVSGSTFTFHMPDYHNGPTHLYLKETVKEIAGAREGGRTFEFTIANPSTNNFEDTLRVTVTNADSKVYESLMPTSVYDGQSLTYRYFIPDDKADFTGGNYTIALSYHEKAMGKWLPLTISQADTLKGDANGDGKVSVTDIAVIVNHILSIPNGTGFSVFSADANGDGNITVTDIGVIVDIILGNSANARKADVLEPQ